MRQLLNCLAYVITASAGIAAWIVIPLVTGEQVAWDSGLYFKVVIPLLTFICGILGFVLHENWWQWGLIVTLAQTSVMIVHSPTSNLLPPGIAALFVLSTPYLIGGFIGERLRQRWGKRRKLRDRVE